jgi:antitoxin (DNA-binding transcriptional repressor) of toxin-antitoxin stability system
MKMVSILDAKDRLSELVATGETVAITENGKPVAVLKPFRLEMQQVISRIRAMRAKGGVLATEDEIVELTRSGRR